MLNKILNYFKSEDPPPPSPPKTSPKICVLRQIDAICEIKDEEL